jgi:hypothetical protein
MWKLAIWVCISFFVGQAQAGDLSWYLWKDVADIKFGGFVTDLRAMKVIASEDGKDRRIVYGDKQGQIHVVRFDDGRFQDEWTSPTLRSAIAEIFIGDVNVDNEVEIVAYTELGDVVFYRSSDYKLIWRSTQDDYASISALTIENIDDDPQLELVFSAEEQADIAGYRPINNQQNSEDERAASLSRLIVFDCKSLFVEWRSEQGLWAQSIVVGDLDDDGVLEIALNTGFIVDATYQRVEWEYPEGFGENIGFADVDGDGIPELIGEFRSTTRPRRFIRIFDVDLQSESFMSGR